MIIALTVITVYSSISVSTKDDTTGGIELLRRGELLEVLPGCSISLEEEASGRVESRCPPYCEDPPESWFELLVCVCVCMCVCVRVCVC